ncbi:hypothetical protein GCM10022221_39640 [Actinocorallia aurea]
MEPASVLAGRYRLDRRIGRGGMGEVWAARDLDLDRDVAVKIVDAGLRENAQVAARLLREARNAASLQHPGITVVHDVGRHGGSPFFVMELLDATDLNGVLQNGRRMAMDRVVDIAVRLADALAHAHSRGVVHRDVKPSNVLLLADGSVKLCDFGISRLAEATALTVEGRILGTPAYMAPEQWRAEPVDARTDVYALGCTVHALLTGAPPFQGNGMALGHRHLTEEPAPPRDLRPDTPPDLDRLVRRMLAKDPADRPADAGAVGASLRALSLGEEPPAVPEPSSPQDSAAPAPARAGVTFAHRSTGPTWKAVFWVCAVLAVAAGAFSVALGLSEDVRSCRDSLRTGNEIFACDADYHEVKAFTAVGACFTTLAAAVGATAIPYRRRREHHSLRVDDAGLELKVGATAYTFAWADTTDAGVHTPPQGPPLLRLHPTFSAPLPRHRHPRGLRPYVDDATGWIIVCPLTAFGAPQTQVVHALATFAGPLWKGAARS